MAETRFKLLEIDLTTGRHQVVDVTGDMRKYLGGRGLGGKILWDRVPAGADPFGPDNVLYFGIGPVTGIFSSITNVSAKSPLTGLRGESNMGGHFGAEMINAGYNAGILITGKSPRPVYIVIKDDEVQIKDASHLWGKLNLDTQQTVRKELRQVLEDQNYRVVSIGPAGENLVRNAGISHDFYHHAARLGMGAVMGSKKVKAIAIRGTRGRDYADPAAVFQMMTRFATEARLKKVEGRRWGHILSIPARYYDGVAGIKNHQLGWDDICNNSNAILFEQRYKVWNDACATCHVACKVPYLRRTPPLGPCAGELRYDNTGGWNANVMLPEGFDTQAYLTPFVDDLGLDSEDVSGVVAWVMECYDRGLVTKADLGGIDLTWGNLKAICQLLEKIARREGIGDVLAEGIGMAPDKWGHGGNRYAIGGKGVAITSFDLRGNVGEAVSFAICPPGALHGNRETPLALMLDSITACMFLRNVVAQVFGGADRWGIEFLKASCGWTLSQEEWQTLLKRITIMERCYSIREGHVPLRDDDIPARFFEEPTHNKYGQVRLLNRQRFLADREKAYLNLGLDKSGFPSKEYLESLGLGFTVPVVEKARETVPV